MGNYRLPSTGKHALGLLHFTNTSSTGTPSRVCVVPNVCFLSEVLVSVYVSGVRGQSSQNTAYCGDSAKKSTQTHWVSEQLPKGKDRRWAVQRWEELPDQTDPGLEENHPLTVSATLPTVTGSFAQFVQKVSFQKVIVLGKALEEVPGFSQLIGQGRWNINIWMRND